MDLLIELFFIIVSSFQSHFKRVEGGGKLYFGVLTKTTHSRAFYRILLFSDNRSKESNFIFYMDYT